MVKKIFWLKTFDEIKSALYTLDKAYEPALSEKMDDFDGYIIKLSQYARNYVYMLDDKVVGMLSVYANDLGSQSAYITQLSVLKEMQGKHIGKNLLEFVVLELKKVNMKIVRLEVKKKNLHAIQFYERNGFQKEQEETKDSFYMIKYL